MNRMQIIATVLWSRAMQTMILFHILNYQCCAVPFNFGARQLVREAKPHGAE